MNDVHWWAVWAEEYPDEGSFKVKAPNKREAKRMTRMLDGGLFAGLKLVAARMTREAILARGRE